MTNSVFMVLLATGLVGMSSCCVCPSRSQNQVHSVTLYEQDGTKTSSTEFIIGDAYAFLKDNALDWGKVLRIERTPDKVIYIVFSTKDKTGRSNRLIWVSPAVVKMASAE